MFTFSDRVAIVTGAAGNLGSAVARAFQAASASLVLVDHKPDRLSDLFPEVASSPDQLLAISADLTDEGSVQEMIDQALGHFGRIDVLVNAAGGWRGGKPVHETPLDTLDFLLNLNTRSVFIASRAVIPSMLDRGSGKIVNVAARAALGAAARNGAYSASKSAVVRLTETMAVELAESGVKVFAISPGLVRTAMVLNLVESPDGQRWMAESLKPQLDGGRDVPPTFAAAMAVELVSGRLDALAGRAVRADRDDAAELARRAGEIVENDERVLRMVHYPSG